MRNQNKIAGIAAAVALAMALTAWGAMSEPFGANAETTADSLLTAVGEAKLTNAASYQAGNGTTYSGVGVTAKTGGTVLVKNSVYIGDNGMNTPVLELLMTPEKSDGVITGWAEAEKMTITFTDAYNPDKFVEVTMDSGTSSLNSARVLARAGAGQTLTGNKKTGGYDAEWAMNVAVGLGGMDETWGTSKHQPYAFYLDGTKLYVSPARNGSDKADAATGAMLIRDFAEETGKNGAPVTDVFDSEVVDISVTVNTLGLTAVDASSPRFEEADYIICSVDGQDMGEQFATVDSKSAGVPVLEYAGVVGTEYVLPKASVFGVKSGKTESETGIFTVKDAAGADVTVTDGKFTPVTAGTYTITCTDGDKVATTALKVLAAVPVAAEISLEGAYEEKVLKGTPVRILPAVLTDEGFNYGTKKYADVSILKGAEAIWTATAEEIACSAEYVFEEKGTYTIRYAVTDSTGAEKTLERVLEVYFDAEFTLKGEMPSAFEPGDEAEFPVATAVYGTENYEVGATLVAPDGKETALIAQDGSDVYDAVVLEQPGEYTVIYDYEFDGSTHTREYSVFVNAYGADLFAADAGSDSIVIGHDGYSYTPTKGVTDTRTGILVTATESGDSFSYQEAVNLNQSLDQPLVEFMIVSDVQGAWGYDFESLQIVLTDKYDATRQVTIDYSVYKTSTNLSLVRAAATGQTLAGWHKNDDGDAFAGDALHDTYGTFLPFGFDGTANTSASNDYTLGFTSVKFYFCENSLYVSPARWKNLGDDANAAYTKVRDFGSDDKYGAGFGEAFEGFTTGEVYLSVKFVGVVPGKTAKLLMLGINGQSLDNRSGILKKNAAPSMTLGEKVYDDAYVGNEICVIDAMVYDIIDGRTAFNGTVAVTYGGEAVVVTDGKFIADKAGTYTVVYSDYKDSAGNTGAPMTCTFEVRERYSVSDLNESKNSYTIGGTEVSFGKEDVSIVDSQTGAVEEYTLTVSLFMGDELIAEGESVTLNDGLAAGEYKVVYQFSYTADGNTYAGKMEKTVVVKEAEQPSDSSSDSSSENVSSDSSDPDGSSVIASSSGGSGTKTGCGSVAGMAGIVAAAIFVGGLVVKAKRKDNE